MSDIHLRIGLRPGDIASLSALVTTSGTAVIGTEQMRDLVLAGPAGSTLVFIAETAAGPVGYLHLEIDVESEKAWLVSGGVEVMHRRRGCGTALMRSASRAAHRHGARVIEISGRPHGYAAPGVDVQRSPETAAFLYSVGAREAGRALAMHRTLHDLESFPARSVPRVRPTTVEDVPELLALVREHLAPDWADTVERYAAGGGDLARILLAHSARGDLIGFAAWGLIGRDPARFGPFGVFPEARGRGAGATLLDEALRRMAGEGLAHAWFQWTAPDSPAHHLYLSRGFIPLRTFRTYRLATDDSCTDEEFQEGIA